MATQLQLRRGTTVENEGFTGALAEVTVDTDTHELRVHDGSTQGGFVIPTQAGVNSDLSGKADKSTTYTKTETDSLLGYKAGTNMDNLTSTGANIANWSTNVSNCIAEIPQDIKLELNNGTLTLKAGSKAYIPNGSGTFNAVTITSDKSVTPSGFSTSSGRFVILDPNQNFNMVDVIADYIYSGTTAPTTFNGNGRAYWYDTTNNVIKRTADSGSTWVGGYSFPIAIVDITNGVGVSNIDQVFNGFGYAGSTIYALPGVKCLIPNGRNADGTLKNTLLTKQSVNVFTPSSATFSQITNIALGSSLSYHTFTYNEAKNINSAPGYMNAGDVTWSNGKITSFNPKTPFHAVDYSDTEFIAHQAMPGSNYINITLGVSGSTYTAPADGYYTITKAAAASNEYLSVYSSSGMNTSVYPPNTMNGRCFFPVSKGDVVTIIYTLSGTTSTFRFIYANGAK